MSEHAVTDGVLLAHETPGLTKTEFADFPRIFYPSLPKVRTTSPIPGCNDQDDLALNV